MSEICEVALRIDWHLLREQKRWLLDNDGPMSDGLLEMIDCIQDQAYAQGCDVQWLTEACDAND